MSAVEDRLRTSRGRACASAGVELRIPDGYRAHWASDPGAAEQVGEWWRRSAERCLYNAPAYIEFARAQNGRGDLLWLTREGTPVLGLPVHPRAGRQIVTGYSGALFGEGGAGALRRGVQALIALLDANTGLRLEVLQSTQAPAYRDPSRMAMLSCLLAGHRLAGPPLYSRLLELGPRGDLELSPRLNLDPRGDHEFSPRLDFGPPGEHELSPRLDAQALARDGMEPYQSELRNQIRQALRNGLQIACSLPATAAERRSVYAEFVPLHQRSWQRTGMAPHPLEYWLALSRAILDAGGRDLLVFAHGGDGQALAAVVCHLDGDAAIYWAGASSERGLELRANPLCLHAAIQACRQLGISRFELGRFHARERSAKERAITRYKAQFGGELVSVVSFRARRRRYRGWARRDLLRAFAGYRWWR